MTWNCGSQGQFVCKWTIQTKRHPNKHLFISWRYKNEPYQHTFIYQKALLAVSIYKNYPLFIKISLPKIVSTKLFTIFQFRAKDTCILALVADVPRKHNRIIVQYTNKCTYNSLLIKYPLDALAKAGKGCRFQNLKNQEYEWQFI